MRGRLVASGLALVLALSQSAVASAVDWGSYANANATRAAAATAARATTQSAQIYGGAIVLAGIAVGIGLYLGLRNRK